MEYDISNKCRACLSEKETMLALFETYENNVTLADIIQHFLNIQVIQGTIFIIYINTTYYMFTAKLT